MSWYRWLACCVCLAVVDAAWLYPTLGIVGFIAGLGHAPVGFFTLVIALLAGVAMVALRDLVPRASPRRVFPMLAVAVLWPGVMVSGPRIGVATGWSWPLDLLSGGVDLAGFLALACVTAVLLWAASRGARRAREGAAGPVISRTFRSGLVILVLVLVFEALGRLDLGTRAALLPFFAASLVGMALARSPVHGARTRSWLLLTGVLTAVALAGAAALGTASVVVLRGGTQAVWETWRELATVARDSVGSTLNDWLGGAGPTDTTPFFVPSVEAPDALVLAVLLAGAALFAALTRHMLRSPPKELPKVVLELSEEAREVLDGDTPGLIRSVERMLATLAGTGRARGDVHAAASASPEERLYLSLLDAARRQGVVVDPTQTANERAADLARALPGVPVDAITAAYVAARFAGVAQPGARLDELTRSLNDAARGSA